MRKLLLLIISITVSLIIISCGSTDSTTNYQISINASPSEGGSVSPSNGEYEEGTSLDISATPSEDYRFVEWQGDYTGTSSSATITIDSDKGIQAIFSKREYALSVNTEGEGTIDETVLQTTSTTDYESGTIVELTANPAEGWKFVQWQGDIVSAENPTQTTVDEAKEVTAVFEKESFAVNINSEGEGSVTISPNQDEYTFGTEIKLTANADQNWEFSEWNGDISKTENPLTITVKNALTITAIFGNTTFAGGSGTAANPYKITTLEHLQSINNYPEAHFIQINDIDASATVNWHNGKGFKPIGDGVVKFSGSYNGKNYSISNLYINHTDRDNRGSGLFGVISKSGIVENINLIDIDITGINPVGGLCGELNGEILNSKVKGNSTVNGTGWTGGLVGLASRGSRVILSSSVSDVTANGTVGGLIGRHHGYLFKSISSAKVTANNDRAGGLVGFNGGKIEASYFNGSVKGQKEIGGLIGLNNSSQPVLKSYSHGEIDGAAEVGGLIGVNFDGKISNSFSTSSLTANEDLGGIIGVNGGEINFCYWDTNNFTINSGVGRGSDDGTIGLKTSEMSGEAAKDNMTGFDFSEIWITTNSYPTLFWE